MATQRFYDGQPGPDIRRELNNFEAILDGTVAAAQDASTDATSASAKAQQWADAAPGVEVETGKYSAKHWAARAQTAVTGGLIYRGSHSAASGAYPATPSLGDYYKISAAGTMGGVEYMVGDSIIYNGTGWDKIDSTDAVTSVAGQVGAVVLTKGDVGLSNVDNTSDVDKPISSATQTALDGKANTAHTHEVADVTGLQAALDGKEPAIAAGTATQYWRGDKTWRDFFTDVRAATLTGLSTATNAVVAATDTVLAAIGKLQAQVSAKFDKTGGDVDGNINFTGTARRITGDFSNATFANRVMFQTSTTNANTDIGILPNGVASSAGIWAFNNGSNLSNTSFLRSYINGATDVRFESGRVGVYSFLPMTFHTGGSERMRIGVDGTVDITGNLKFPGTAQRITGDFSNATIANRLAFQTSAANGITSVAAIPNGSGTAAQYALYNRSDVNNATLFDSLVNSAEARIRVLAVGTGSNLPLVFQVGGLDRLRIDPTTGNVLVTSPAVLGYGVGAGGTVVQATSKSTAVTLNKPTGQITMNNAALAAGALVTFQLNNNLITAVDALILTIDASSITGIPTEKYSVSGAVFGSGAYITVKNISAGPLSEALRINFTIIKGATS